eukprot:9960587-Lingulodinium_polyedra.AAC.1
MAEQSINSVCVETAIVPTAAKDALARRALFGQVVWQVCQRSVSAPSGPGPGVVRAVRRGGGAELL